MSAVQKVLRIGLVELDTVRFVCQVNGCSHVAEIGLSDLQHLSQSGDRGRAVLTCPKCSRDLGGNAVDDVFLDDIRQLVKAVAAVKRRGNPRIEFAIVRDDGNS